MELGVVGADQRPGMKRKGGGLQQGKSEEGGAGQLGQYRAGGRVGFLNPTGLFRGRGYRCGLYTLREQVVPRGGGCGRQIESQYKLLRNFPGVPVGKAVLPLQGMPVYPWLGNQDHARCAVWSKINKQIIIIIIIKQHLPMDRLPQV